MDNFGKVKRPMNIEDLKITHYTLESSVEIYYEFPFPWKTTKTKNILFGEKNLDDMKAKYGSVDETEAYSNICYVKLSSNSPDTEKVDQMLAKLKGY